MQAPGMQTGQLPLAVSAASILPAPLGNLIRPFEPKIQSFFFPDELVRSLSRAGTDAEGAVFADRFLQDLQINYEVSSEDLSRIPASGPALVIANHPFGFLEGFLLLSILEKVRSDYRIVANSLLSSVAAVRSKVIGLNPFAEQKATQDNARSLRLCVEWLAQNGLLVMFPAGEVAHLTWAEQAVADPKWNATAIRLARKAGCATVPLFFDGSNSIPFQMVGTLHSSFRTLNLARELMKKRAQTVSIRIGSPIPAAVLKSYQDAESATEYVRARLYLLSNRIEKTQSLFRRSSAEEIANNAPPDRSNGAIAREVEALSQGRLLLATDEYAVYLASADEIPNTLHEIGRCRELAFREAGEGAKTEIDLDRFDRHYKHLFLWHRRDQRVAGAYRLCATQDVLRSYGIGGLYTSSLFHYSSEFFDRLGPAFELGRSFVRAEYQRHYAPLLLLWKGIAKCVELRPECAVLFGAVSISNNYHPLSRVLIKNYLTRHTASELVGSVRPRRGFRTPPLLPKHVRRLDALMTSLDELSASVSDLECDGKGVPVLIRHYVKIGGRVLCFNVDPKFSNALDGLIFADLREATPLMLDRCMGKTGAASFRAWHRSESGSLAYAEGSGNSL